LSGSAIELKGSVLIGGLTVLRLETLSCTVRRIRASIDELKWFDRKSRPPFFQSEQQGEP
jgi:hypothetical protein